MEHESGRTTMDYPNIVYCTNIRATLVGQFVVLQQWTLLRVFLYNTRLLRRYAHYASSNRIKNQVYGPVGNNYIVFLFFSNSFCDLQFHEFMLRIFGRWRKHNERNPWKTHSVSGELMQNNVLWLCIQSI